MGLAHGIHGWVDVAVPDMDAGEAFYRDLFGWEAVGGDAGESMPYTMFSKEGRLVAGMGPLAPDQVEAGQPPAWSTYIIVDDVDAVQQRAVELGATPIMEPMQIMDSGRMTFILDPVGAAVGLWEPGTHGGADLFNEPGSLTWNDLNCRDVEAAKAFYGELLGWEASPMETPSGTYWTFSNAGRMNGGTLDISRYMPDEVPAHWLNWFRVDDCAATAAKAAELGGSVQQEPRESDIGVAAVLSDPFGATFGVIATEQSDGQPPR